MSLEPTTPLVAIDPQTGKASTTVRLSAKTLALRPPAEEVEEGHVGLAHDWVLDQSLSFKARGILALLHTEPEGEPVTIRKLVAEQPHGRDYLLTGLRELAEAGWVETLYFPAAKPAIPPELRMAVLQRDGFRCVACDIGEDLMADHVIPESKGGPTTFENLQTMCRPCNSRKGTKTQPSETDPEEDR